MATNGFKWFPRRPSKVIPTIERNEEKKFYFGNKMDMGITSLFLGLNGVKVHIDHEISWAKEP